LASSQVQWIDTPRHRSPSWEKATHAQWCDWRWQLTHRLGTLDELRAILRLTPDEEAGIRLATQRFQMQITPYFARLMEPDDPHCPLRRQVIPVATEAVASRFDFVDPCGEEADSPVPGLVHRYPDRVLLLPTVHCAAYCRFCTRSRIVGHAEEMLPFSHLEPAFAYIQEHAHIRDVLISGGDPLTIGDHKLALLLDRLRAIPHVEIVRLGTRVPVFLPQRITDELAAMLTQYHPLWMSIHINHPKEITPDMAAACIKLANAGIPLGGQTVLLKGVNDDPQVMKQLMHDLLKIRVRPYYLYQCDPVVGTSHLRTPLTTGLRIMEHLRGHTTGYAVPTFVIDAPGGGGKIPIGPDYTVSHQDDRMVLRNFRGDVYEYYEPE
jgi:lysine 2,3-aminomutase